MKNKTTLTKISPFIKMESKGGKKTLRYLQCLTPTFCSFAQSIVPFLVLTKKLQIRKHKNI